MSGANVKSKGTLPERRVQAAALELGFRFRRNAGDLPGSPDLVFDELEKVVFVHGCFWHLHRGCPGMRIPHATKNRAYWYGKLARNALRDERVTAELRALGWKVLVVWECETRPVEGLLQCLGEFLGKSPVRRGALKARRRGQVRQRRRHRGRRG